MKKIVNFRIPVLIAIVFVLGILLGYLFIFYAIGLIWIIAVIPITAVIVIICALKKNYKIIFIALFASLFFIAGTVNCNLRLASFDNCTLDDKGSYYITATVCEKGESAYGEYIILNYVSADGKRTDGKIIAYLKEKYGDFCDTGYKVSFFAEITKKPLFLDGELNYYAQENIKYSCNVYGNLKSNYGFSLFGSIRSALRETLYNNLDGDTAAIVFAMLTGNTQGVDEGAMTSFRYGGIAHIFAVSGLHIGIIYGALHFLLKKLKLNKFARVAICLLLIFFYSGVCGFTPSSIRAAIMCAVSALASLVYKKYDSFNALALAIIIITAINPFNLFAVGFQLSVGAMAGIVLLSKNISRLFKRVPEKLSGPVSVAISAQAGTMPVMLACFGYVSGAGLLMNILVLPVLSALFVILFMVTSLSTVISAIAAFVLPVAALPLEFLVSLFYKIGFENSLISGFGGGLFVPVYFIGLILLSDKINIQPHVRIASTVTAVSVLCIYVLAS